MLESLAPPVSPRPERLLERLRNLAADCGRVFDTLRQAASTANEALPALLKYVSDRWVLQFARLDRRSSAGLAWTAETNRELDRLRRWWMRLLDAALGTRVECESEFLEETMSHPTVSRACLTGYPLRSLAFPVAAAGPPGSGAPAGRLYRFQLELYSDAAMDRCAMHPLQAGLLPVDDRFLESIRLAWETARHQARANSGSREEDHGIVAWQMADFQKDPAEMLAGPSGGGAFALGFLRLFRDQPYDPRLIVISSIDSNGAPGAVSPENLRAKTAAIVQDGGIATIATVSAHLSAIQRELDRLGASDRIRVVSIDPSG